MLPFAIRIGMQCLKNLPATGIREFQKDKIYYKPNQEVEICRPNHSKLAEQGLKLCLIFIIKLRCVWSWSVMVTLRGRYLTL
jgi:hypothetical protein